MQWLLLFVCCMLLATAVNQCQKCPRVLFRFDRCGVFFIYLFASISCIPYHLSIFNSVELLFNLIYIQISNSLTPLQFINSLKHSILLLYCFQNYSYQLVCTFKKKALCSYSSYKLYMFWRTSIQTIQRRWWLFMCCKKLGLTVTTSIF